jgi:ribonuclease G
LEREIIVEVYPWESRVAVVENGRLVEIFWADQNDNVGNIYKGRVKDIIPGLSCAFIDIGLAKNAFLYAYVYMLGRPAIARLGMHHIC